MRWLPLVFSARMVDDVILEFGGPEAPSGEFSGCVRQIEYGLECVMVGSNNEA